MLHHALPSLRSIAHLPPPKAVAACETLRILAPLRHGPGGVEPTNALLENILGANRGPWFPGRLIMVLDNEPDLDLANGDVGIVLSSGQGPMVWFPSPQGLRAIPPGALGRVESCFASTVHKSQGSEWETVVLVLPPEDHALITRELIYTAATRAKKRLIVLGLPEMVARAATRPSQRMSGLAERLWATGQTTPGGG